MRRVSRPVFEAPRAVAVPGASVGDWSSRPTEARGAFGIQSLCRRSKKGLKACSWDRTAGTRFEAPCLAGMLDKINVAV